MRPLSYYLQSLVFCNHFEELRTMLFEVELIINILPKYYQNMLNTQNLLFARQLLLSSNTTLTVATNLSVLSSTTDKVNRISNPFWDRWRHEYVVNLLEAQRISKLNIKRGKGTQTLLENYH